MHEDEARQLLRDQAHAYDVAPMPGELLVARGRRARQRRLLAVGAVAAVTALIVGGAYVAVGNDDSKGPPAPTAVEPPVADPGHRLVGIDRLVVQVPESWSTNQVGCDGHTPMKDTVLFEDGLGDVVELCDPNAPVVSAVTLSSDYSSSADRWVEEAQPDGDLDGVPVESALPRLDKGVWSAALVVPSLDVLVWVTSPDERVVKDVLGSAAVLPEGYVAVPDAHATPAGPGGNFERVGLDQVLVEEPHAGLAPGSILRTEPAVGSVVAVGSLVRVIIVGKGPAESKEWPAQLVPGPAINCVYAYPDQLRLQANAFDATITHVEEHPEDYVGDGSDFRVQLTMRLNEVFMGTAGREVTMKAWTFMLPPDPQSVVGTRIIAASGPSLEVMACGFTRAYTPEDAADWREVFRSAAEADAYDAVTQPDRQVVDAFTAFAFDPTAERLADVPFATELKLGLAGQVRRTVANASLLDAQTWRLPGPFRARVGGFSALEVLTNHAEQQLSIGAHAQCGPVGIGAPQQTASELQALRQVSIQASPGSFDSCLDWWSVDLFLDDDGVIQAVTLDLWEP